MSSTLSYAATALLFLAELTSCASSSSSSSRWSTTFAFFPHTTTHHQPTHKPKAHQQTKRTHMQQYRDKTHTSSKPQVMNETCKIGSCTLCSSSLFLLSPCGSPLPSCSTFFFGTHTNIHLLLLLIFKQLIEEAYTILTNAQNDTFLQIFQQDDILIERCI